MLQTQITSSKHLLVQPHTFVQIKYIPGLVFNPTKEGYLAKITLFSCLQ